MNRTITYQIGEYGMPMTVAGFLRLHGFSSRNLTDLKKTENGVLLDGAPVYLNHKIGSGQELRIQIVETEVSAHIPPVKLPLDIVYEDEDLMVVNKPAGMPIHTSLNNYENTLANALAYYFKEQGKPFVYRCVNRLDRDTSGLTVIAKHKVSAGILGSMLAAKSQGGDAQSGPGSESRKGKHSSLVRKLGSGNVGVWKNPPRLEREYLAIVRGKLPQTQGTIDAPIGRAGTSIIERKIDFAHGERAVTHYRVLEEINGCSLLSLKLETGRTHQIRVHLKHIGYPLIGDYLYNPDMEKINRQALHSYRLKFPHPITGEAMEFTAELPQDMRAVLERG